MDDRNLAYYLETILNKLDQIETLLLEEEAEDTEEDTTENNNEEEEETEDERPRPNNTEITER